jgi:hypothetical protein
MIPPANRLMAAPLTGALAFLTVDSSVFSEEGELD